jgi:hypothetical protein
MYGTFVFFGIDRNCSDSGRKLRGLISSLGSGWLVDWSTDRRVVTPRRDDLFVGEVIDRRKMKRERVSG